MQGNGRPTFLDLKGELGLLQVDLQGLHGVLHAAELALGLIEVDHDALALLLCLGVPLLQVLQEVVIASIQALVQPIGSEDIHLTECSHDDCHLKEIPRVV